LEQVPEKERVLQARGCDWGSHPDFLKTQLLLNATSGEAMARKWAETPHMKEKEEEEGKNNSSSLRTALVSELTVYISAPFLISHFSWGYLGTP
jgi:hypothetical protein